jgi:uncharacterized protein (UPF0335 family)
VPIHLNNDWNVISRTIVPLMSQHHQWCRRSGFVAGIRTSQSRCGIGSRRCRTAVNHLSAWLAWLTHWSLLCGHFRASIYQGGTMSDVTIPGGKIRAFVERIENLDTEMLELSEQKKEVFAEAKGEGFDVKILKEIVKLRKQDQEERDERESLLDLYMRAMEQAGPEKVAKAA